MADFEINLYETKRTICYLLLGLIVETLHESLFQIFPLFPHHTHKKKRKKCELTEFVKILLCTVRAFKLFSSAT